MRELVKENDSPKIGVVKTELPRALPYQLVVENDSVILRLIHAQQIDHTACHFESTSLLGPPNQVDHILRNLRVVRHEPRTNKIDHGLPRA
jgi:hypothetical protein